MVLPLNYGLGVEEEKKPKGLPLDYGLSSESKGLPLTHGLDIVPEQPEVQAIPGVSAPIVGPAVQAIGEALKGAAELAAAPALFTLSGLSAFGAKNRVITREVNALPEQYHKEAYQIGIDKMNVKLYGQEKADELKAERRNKVREEAVASIERVGSAASVALNTSPETKKALGVILKPLELLHDLGQWTGDKIESTLKDINIDEEHIEEIVDTIPQLAPLEWIVKGGKKAKLFVEKEGKNLGLNPKIIADLSAAAASAPEITAYLLAPEAIGRYKSGKAAKVKAEIAKVNELAGERIAEAGKFMEDHAAVLEGAVKERAFHEDPALKKARAEGVLERTAEGAIESSEQLAVRAKLEGDIARRNELLQEKDIWKEPDLTDYSSLPLEREVKTKIQREKETGLPEKEPGAVESRIEAIEEQRQKEITPLKSPEEFIREIEQTIQTERLLIDKEILQKKEWLERGVDRKDVAAELGQERAGEAAAMRLLEETSEMPKYAGSINLQKQAITKEAKAIELEILNDKGVGSKISHNEVITKANEIVDRFKKDPKYYNERISEIQKGKTPTIEEELAHRVINAGNLETLVEASKGVADGSIRIEDYRKLENEIASTTTKITDPLASDTGRRLNTYNIEVGKYRAHKAITEAIEGNKKKGIEGLNERQRKDMNEVDWSDPTSIDNFIKTLPDPKMKDLFYEFWYTSLLSGIPTHIVNATSNTLWGAWQIPHEGLVAALDLPISKLTGKPRQRYLNETIPRMAGYVTGFSRGKQKAWDLVRHGGTSKFESKWTQEIGQAIGAFERSNNPKVRKLGKVFANPVVLRALRAMDVMGNSIAYDGNMRAISQRLINEGKLKEGRQTKEFMENPPEWAHNENMEKAKYTTFMDDPGGITQAILKAREDPAWQGTGRLVVPFVNTIGNLLKRGTEMTPIVGGALRKSQLPAEFWAKQIEGTVISYLVWNKMLQGEITGDVPNNKAEREAFYRPNKKPWSVKIGDNWYSYRRIEPFNTIVSTNASLYESFKNAKDDTSRMEIMAEAGNSIKNNLLDSSMLTGVASILNRHGARKGVVPRFASSLVPYSGFFRSVNRLFEAMIDGSAKVRDTSSWLGASSAVIPGLYKLVDPKLNVWGEDIELQGGPFRQWIPYKWTTEKNDPLEKALETLDVYPSLPQETYKYRKEQYDFDEDIYTQYAVDFGTRARKILDRLVLQEGFKNALGNEKLHEKLQGKIDSILTEQRNRARKRAIIEQRQRNKRMNK